MLDQPPPQPLPRYTSRIITSSSTATRQPSDVLMVISTFTMPATRSWSRNTKKFAQRRVIQNQAQAAQLFFAIRVKIVFQREQFSEQIGQLIEFSIPRLRNFNFHPHFRRSTIFYPG